MNFDLSRTFTPAVFSSTLSHNISTEYFPPSESWLFSCRFRDSDAQPKESAANNTRKIEFLKAMRLILPNNNVALGHGPRRNQLGVRLYRRPLIKRDPGQKMPLILSSPCPKTTSPDGHSALHCTACPILPGSLLQQYDTRLATSLAMKLLRHFACLIHPPNAGLARVRY